jgi:trimethylamine--corrinoid protein Co-methyltransferase
MNRRFVDGVSLEDSALALDVVNEVGPGGEFLSHDHTLAHWRELWLPQQFDRQRLEPWQEEGSPPINDRLRKNVTAIMDEHRAPSLPASVNQELDRILAQ